MSRDLQATHHILALLEKSKRLSDETVDQLPGLFLVASSSGVILRANLEISKFLPISPEEALDLHLTQLLGEESWLYFQKSFALALAGQDVPEFEMTVGTSPETTRIYLWKIQKIEIHKRPLLRITGRDVSEVKTAASRILELQRDQEIMTTVQTLLLPQEARFDSTCASGLGHYQPTEHVGGDWWWQEELPDKSLVLAVGDITGHGVGPAMVTSFMMGLFQAHLASQVHLIRAIDVPEILRQMEQKIQQMKHSPYWMTILVFHVRPDLKQIHWWNAGAPPAFVFHRTGKCQTALHGSTPIGSGRQLIETGVFPYESGDRLIVATDGLYEARGKLDLDFGVRRALKVFEKSRSLSIDESLTQILAAVDEWRGPLPLADDLTMILADLK